VRSSLWKKLSWSTTPVTAPNTKHLFSVAIFKLRVCLIFNEICTSHRRWHHYDKSFEAFLCLKRQRHSEDSLWRDCIATSSYSSTQVVTLPACLSLKLHFLTTLVDSLYNKLTWHVKYQDFVDFWTFVCTQGCKTPSQIEASEAIRRISAAAVRIIVRWPWMTLNNRTALYCRKMTISFGVHCRSSKEDRSILSTAKI